MSGEGYQCFTCSSKITTKNSVKTNYSSLSSNINVFFVLRKVLHVPSILLKDQLKESGINPQDWIRLCDQCTHLIKKGRHLHQEITKIEKQFRSVRKQIVENLLGSRLLKEDYDNLKKKAYLDRNSLLFDDKIRLFVKTCKN